MSTIRENISSDSLFHFIRKRKWLKKILKEKSFQARYVYEDIYFTKIKMGVPMKCFCDIPLGKIKLHLKTFGKFGIGITKKYARQNKITPVLYIHNNSDTIGRYLNSIDFENNLESGFSLFPYFKMEENITTSPKGKKKISRYYDEREWRFVPEGATFINLVDAPENEIKKKIDSANELIDKDRSKYKLNFEYDDITYIFVQNQLDRKSIIKEIKSLRIAEEHTDLLISKIITSDQICLDF